MGKTTYLNVSEINELQTKIMQFIQDWARDQKTPCPRQQIVLAMKKSSNTAGFTTVNAIEALIRKGYIRRATTFSNKTMYVQIRRI